MKEKIFTLLFLNLIMVSFAQTDDLNCKVVAEAQFQQCYNEFSASIEETDLDNFEPVVVNIFFWEIKDNDGNIDITDHAPGWDFEKESLDVVAELNIKYNPFKIFFKYKGTSEIHNTELYNHNTNIDYFILLNSITNYSDEEDDVKKTDAINAYVDPKVSGGFASPFVPRYGLSRGTFDNTLNVSTHEVGHIFALLHTHAYWLNCTHPGGAPFESENITRTVTDSSYNAHLSGDRVPDTAASPDVKYQKCYELNYTPPYYEGCENDPVYGDARYFYMEDCSYINTSAAQCEIIAYNIPDNDIKNIMSYAKDECKSIFTIGQGIRMREAIETACAEPNPSSDTERLQEAINPDGIASLYEPYKGEYYFAGPLPVDDDGNLNPPLYQPGFDYNFISCDCDCPLPLDYGETGFTYNSQSGTFISKYEGHYNLITHPNHTAIDIIILNESQPWRCYDNNNRKPSGGTIIKFNDNVFNTNVTITQQDSTAINDENLIDNLDPGLYNIIEQYQEGDTEENVIIKENN